MEQSSDSSTKLLNTERWNSDIILNYGGFSI